MSYTCSVCGAVYEHYDDGRYDIHGNWVCDDCIDREFVSCVDCGEVVHGDEAEEINGQWYCPECATNIHRAMDNEGICSYHAHHCIDPKFFGDDNSTHPYLGVELEVDKGGERDSVADEVKRIVGGDFIYQESDGSLRSGFENITQPATLSYHESKEEEYRNMFRYLVHEGYRSHNTSTCGLHVHFNRDFFSSDSDLYITRLLYIVDKFWDNLVKFSRRTEDNLDRWAKKYDRTPTEILADMHRHYIDRYYAINLSNEDTIEFRMFRGTLNPNTFFATLELVDTIVCKCKTIANEQELQNVQWEDLLVTDRLKAYWEVAKNR